MTVVVVRIATFLAPMSPMRLSTRRGSNRLTVTCYFFFVVCFSFVDAIPPHPHKRVASRPISLRTHLRGGKGVRDGTLTEEYLSNPENFIGTERWVTQPLDHFDANDVAEALKRDVGSRFASTSTTTSTLRTWHQRWFANAKYFNPDSSTNRQPVVFLCVGGEGPGFEPSVVTTGGPHCGLAVSHAKELYEKNNDGALIVALEHRFYGASQPTGDLKLESLRYLSSEQALHDLARFVECVVDEFELPNTQDKNRAPKFIAFGGSYPGMLAGWLRLKFPHLFLGAVASSAPVQATFAMPGYDFYVGQALSDEVIGGSADCFDSVRDAFGEIEELLKESSMGKQSDDDSSNRPGRRHLERLFKICSRSEFPLDTDNNVGEFLTSLTEVVPAQSNDPSCDSQKNKACDVNAVCRLMVDDKKVSDSLTIRSDGTSGAKFSPYSRKFTSGSLPIREPSGALERFANATRLAFGFSDDGENTGDCLDIDHELNLKHMANESLPADWRQNTYDGDRAWFWQTCTEFGFYQTCEDEEKCPAFFSQKNKKYMTLEFFSKPCVEIFGLNYETVVKTAAERSNTKYGGWAPSATNIVYTSGSVDPWRANSFTPNLSNKVPHKSKRIVDRDTPTLMVNGASHHAWTHPPRSDDQESVKHAREVIKRQVDAWLQGEEGYEEL